MISTGKKKLLIAKQGEGADKKIKRKNREEPKKEIAKGGKPIKRGAEERRTTGLKHERRTRKAERGCRR